MRCWIKCLIGISAFLAIGGMFPASAQDVGAVSSGDWNNGLIWTTGAPPGISNNVYIGSTYPSLTASTATVTLTQAQSANNVYLGNGNGTNGTLDLAGNALTITSSLFIGQNGGSGSLNDAGGSFTAQNAYVQNGNALSFGANDAISYLQLSGGSSATTAATGNVTASIDVLMGSTLSLGSNMNLSGYLNVQDSGSTLNMAGHSLTTPELDLGYFGSSPVTVTNTGSLDVTSLYVGNGTALALHGGDTIAYAAVVTGGTLTLGADTTFSNSITVQDSGSTLNMAGHSLTTPELDLGYFGSSPVTVTNTGSLDVTSLYVGNGTALALHGGDTIAYAAVVTGGTLTLGADTTFSNSITVQDSGSTLNMAGHSLTTPELDLGYFGSSPVTVTNTGSLDVTSLYVGNGTALALHGGDTIAYAAVVTGGTLTLGADTTFSNSITVQDSGSTLNMAGHSLTTPELDLGYFGSSPVTVTNTGSLDVTSLYVGNGTALALHGGDTIAYAAVVTGGTLTLGADTTFSNSITVQDSGSTLNMAGHSLTTPELDLGYFGSSPVTVTNVGSLDVGDLNVGHGTALTLHGGDVVNSQINLQGGSVLTVQQTNGIGLTLNGSLTIDPSSIDLIFNLNNAPNWDFRWADFSSSSNWISTIDTMIADGQIVITAPQGYQVVDQGGYTYIDGLYSTAVPEPSSLVLACIAVGVTLIGVAWRHRRGETTPRNA